MNLNNSLPKFSPENTCSDKWQTSKGSNRNLHVHFIRVRKNTALELVVVFSKISYRFSTALELSKSFIQNTALLLPMVLTLRRTQKVFNSPRKRSDYNVESLFSCYHELGKVAWKVWCGKLEFFLQVFDFSSNHWCTGISFAEYWKILYKCVNRITEFCLLHFPTTNATRGSSHE